jgi:hypothetical protein
MVAKTDLDSNLRRMIIAKIETEETRVFPTRTKTNFSICLQLISSEEYLMRNFYQYKDNREKIIQTQLVKIGDQLQKQSFTPAKLLLQSNANTQFNKLVKKSKTLTRPSENAPSKYEKNSMNTMSKN